MTLDVPAEYEAIIRRAVESGAFNSVDEAMRHALALLEREQKATSPQKGEPSLDSTGQDLQALPDDVDADTVAQLQGVAPIQDPDAGAAESWPREEEDFDAWLADLQALRAQGMPRTIS